MTRPGPTPRCPMNPFLVLVPAELEPASFNEIMGVAVERRRVLRHIVNLGGSSPSTPNRFKNTINDRTKRRD